MKKKVEKKRRKGDSQKKVRITDETHSLLWERKYKVQKIRFKLNFFIYSLIFCFGVILFFQFHPNSNEEFQPEEKENIQKETEFFFFDQFWEKYNVFEKNVHGAPLERKYLYEEIAEETIQKLEREDEHFTSNDKNENYWYESGKVELFFQDIRENIASIGEKINEHQRKKGEENSDWDEREDKDNNLIGKRYRDIGRYLLVDNPNIPVEEKEVGIHLIPNYRQCMTPRGYKIDHWESIIAYKQDKNTYDDCNLERRYCYDGKLSGTFTEKSCKVNSKYSYYEKTFVSYYTNQKSDLIQSEKQPQYREENYKTNKHGIEEILDVKPVHQITDYYTTEPTVREEKSEIEQHSFQHENCRAPWGEKVNHWQFVKAYKHKNGFSDYPCEVQIRLCVDWELEWTYQYDSCYGWNTSYLDRLDGYPTRWSMDLKPLTGKKLEYVNNLRKIESEYEKIEEGHFKTPLRDKILDLLDEE